MQVEYDIIKVVRKPVRKTEASQIGILKCRYIIRLKEKGLLVMTKAKTMYHELKSLEWHAICQGKRHGGDSWQYINAIKKAEKQRLLLDEYDHMLATEAMKSVYGSK